MTASGVKLPSWVQENSFLRRLTTCIALETTSDLVQADSVDAALKHLQKLTVDNTHNAKSPHSGVVRTVMNASHDQTDRVDRARLVEFCGVDDSSSWNLGRAKQGDTIRVDGTSPRG